MPRVTFDSIFMRHTDGSLEPKQTIRVGGVEFGPGVRFTRGVSFAGIDFTLFIGKDFDTETDSGGVIIINSIYQ